LTCAGIYILSDCAREFNIDTGELNRDIVAAIKRKGRQTKEELIQVRKMGNQERK
jgi:hypothetical protein